MRALILLAAIAGLYFASRWFLAQPRRNQLRIAALTVVAALLVLAATGRLNWIVALVGALFLLLRRLLPLLSYLPTFQRLYRHLSGSQPGARPSARQQSRVDARFVSMTLDHDSGEMDGRVLEGRFADKSLSELSLDQLLGLLSEWQRQDEESTALLRAYLDRVHGEQWHERAQPEGEPGAGGFSGEMNRNEAYQILGLEEGASEEQIIEAHRRLMQKLHPDRGGSTFLAAKINQAKRLLMSTK